MWRLEGGWSGGSSSITLQRSCSEPRIHWSHQAVWPTNSKDLLVIIPLVLCSTLYVDVGNPHSGHHSNPSSLNSQSGSLARGCHSPLYPKGKEVPRDSNLPVSTRTPSGVLRMLRQREGRAVVVVLSHMPSATLVPSPIFFIQTHTPVREKWALLPRAEKIGFPQQQNLNVNSWLSF